MPSIEEVSKVFKSDSKEEKIRIIESLSDSSNFEIINLLVSKLDDADIQVRGEAFSALMLNKNDISDILIENLKNQSKNIRGYSALVLANRNSKKAIPEIIQLAEDQSAMVRSCAIGALGHLRASEGAAAIKRCLGDHNIEVKKSAIKSAIDIGDKGLLAELAHLSGKDDPEIRHLLARGKQLSGPGGI